MEQNWKCGGLLPSAMALKASLSRRPGTSPEPTMLTPYQRDLLLQGEKEIDESLANSQGLRALLRRLGRESEPAEMGTPPQETRQP